MAKLSRDEVLNLAKLAHIKITDAEVAKFQVELGNILKYVEQLADVDTKDLQPTSQVTGLTNVKRDDDSVTDTMDRSELLANVPKQKDGFIEVRRVL